KKDDGVESKGTRENNVVGLEKTGVRPPLIENWVDGVYHMDELRRLNRIKFHEDDNRLVDILVICNLYEDLRAKNLSLEYAVSKHTRQDDMAKQEKFLTRHLLLYGEDFEKGTVYHELLQYHVGTTNGVKIGLSFTEKIEIICDGVSNKKMTERWYNICYELNKIDKLVVGEKSILPILLSNQFSLGEFEILYQQIISLDQQTDKTLQLLRKILEEKIDGEKIEKFERWGILEEKYQDSLLRILDGENADIVLDEAGLLN
ncbi:hypothetical protein N8809_06135, partial [Euryarchaeota archaeon]|nr:hypothetical protein [Euryarchaeota archaeon]